VKNNDQHHKVSYLSFVHKNQGCKPAHGHLRYSIQSIQTLDIKSSALKQVKGRLNKSNGIVLLLFARKKSITKRNASHILIIHQEPKPTVQRLK
jgi:hypothetical protein